MNQDNVSHLNRDVRIAPGAKAASSERNIATLPYRPRPAYTPPSDGDRKKFIAKGHDSQLQDAQINKTLTVITLLCGEVARGSILRRDKYTITLRHSDGVNAGRDEIFYKHAIQGVLILSAEAPQPFPNL